jgi:hypothetical protein
VKIWDARPLDAESANPAPRGAERDALQYPAARSIEILQLNEARSSVSDIPPSEWTWINAAAGRFERAWKQGTRPRIEDYVDDDDEERWQRLPDESLRVDCELCRRAGE